MRHAVVAAAAAALVLAASAAGASGAQLVKPVRGHEFQLSARDSVPGEVLVGYRGGISRAAIAQVPGRAGLRVGSRFGAFRLDLLKVPRGLLVRDAVRRLERDPAVAFAEPNYLRHLSTLTPPTDALFSDQWDLSNTGQLHAVSDSSGDGSAPDHQGTSGDDIDWLDAADAADGSGNPVVAVIDTGVDVNQPDLQNQLWTNLGDPPGNGDEDLNGKVDDVHGWNFAAAGVGNATLLPPPFADYEHGTHVAGTIAAEADGTVGTVGVCPQCQIMVLRVASNSGDISVSSEIKALAYAKSMGAKIVNISLGAYTFSLAERTAIRKSGALVVVAAGNDSLDNDMALVVDVNGDGVADYGSPTYPAAYTDANILTVAATNHDDEYGYSTECLDYGPPYGTKQTCAFTNWGHDSVDLGAPGVDITSTVPAAAGSYETWDGTSMAAPHVAGVAGLVLSHHSGYSVAQLKNAVMHGVDAKSSLHTMYIAPPLKKTKTGAFTRTSGRLNAFNALSASPANATPASDGNVDHAKGWSTARKKGSVAWPADVNDVYKRKLAKGHKYRFTLVVPKGKDYDLYVWNKGTTEIWQPGKLRGYSARGKGADEVVTITAKKKGTYYVHVSAWLFQHGGYTLKFKRVS